MKRSMAALLAAALPALGPGAARAADHANLDEGLPLQLRDAYPITRGSIEAQGLFRYDRGRSGDGRDAYRLEPRIEWGAFRNGQVTFRVPYTAGNSEARSGRGFAGAGLLYNFNQERIFLPAFALEGEVAQRFGGRGGTGTETTLWGIATKTIGGYRVRRISLNLGWIHRFDADPDERRNQYVFVAGYHQAIGPDTTLVLDYVRRQQERGERDANILEAGLRYQLDPRTVLSAGVGAGIGRDSPAVRVVFGIQHNLSWPPN
ncbi:MAG: hypothetical protein K2X49_09625 [Acetobacteraceae bacterium]|nr:hypothetical protein [Acetobacteraceae bacterium]